MAGLRRLLATHGWWLLAAAIVTLVVTVTTGWFLFPVYGVANATGTVLYLERPRRRRARARRVILPILTVLQVPVGLLASLLRRRADPIEAILSDEEMQEHTAVSNAFAERSRHLGSRPFTPEHLYWRAKRSAGPRGHRSDSHSGATG